MSPTVTPPNPLDHTLAFVAVALRGDDVVAVSVSGRRQYAVMRVLADESFDYVGDRILVGTLTSYVEIGDHRGEGIWPNP